MHWENSGKPRFVRRDTLIVFPLKRLQDKRLDAARRCDLSYTLSNHVFRQFLQRNLSATRLTAIEVSLKLVFYIFRKRSVYCIASKLLGFSTIHNTTS